MKRQVPNPRIFLGFKHLLQYYETILVAHSLRRLTFCATVLCPVVQLELGVWVTNALQIITPQLPKCFGTGCQKTNLNDFFVDFLGQVSMDKIKRTCLTRKIVFKIFHNSTALT